MFNTVSFARVSNIYCGNLRLRKMYGYTTNDGEYWISGVLSPTTTTEIKVPSVADDNLEITAIYDNTKASGVFQGNIFLEKVDLSESKIRLIGTYCFKDCKYLTDFENSKYLIEISGYAFQGANLNSITLYDGIEKIQKSAFEDAFSNEKSIYVINIPDSVTKIGENAFKVTDKNYRVVLVGKKGSIAEEYCETDSTCTFMERGDKIPTEEEILEEEMRKEKNKIFENPKFDYNGYNNTDNANLLRYFCLPASTLKSSNEEAFSDIIVVDDGFIVVGFCYIDKYHSDSKYIQETYLSKAKGNDDAIIVKYDYDLNMQYFKSFGGSLGDKFEKIYKTKDGGYLVLGKTCSRDKDLLNINNNTSNYQSMAVKYDNNLNVISVEMGDYSKIYEKNKDKILEDGKGDISDGKIILNNIRKYRRNYRT